MESLKRDQKEHYSLFFKNNLGWVKKEISMTECTFSECTVLQSSSLKAVGGRSLLSVIVSLLRDIERRTEHLFLVFQSCAVAGRDTFSG